jgi:two-component system NtrC family sensor kinase
LKPKQPYGISQPKAPAVSTSTDFRAKWEDTMPSDHASEYLLKAVNAFNRSIIVLSTDFRILAAGGRLIGERAADFLGQHCHRMLYDRDSPCDSCGAQEVLRTGKHVLRIKSGESLNQQQIACHYTYPIFSGDQIEALVSMDLDIPAGGELEDSLQRTNALLRNLLLSAADAIIAADRKGHIIIFNEAAAQVLGYSVDEALNQLDIRQIYPPGVAHEIMRKLRSEEYGGKGKLKGYAVKVTGKSGEHIPISLYASIVYENEQEVGTIGFFHDQREILRMQDELQKTQLQLLQAEKMASLGKLAAGVAHQLNNPLGGITLFTKLLMEEHSLETAVRADLERILRDAQRCRDTVKELLEFARQSRYEMRPQDINQAISRTLFLVENHSIFQNVQIEKILAPDLPLVPADIQQLNHLFMNIIFNAAQAMQGTGKLTLKTFLHRDQKRVCISIGDTGPGIPPEILPRIFEPFFTTKEEGQGTGLGLSLAYSIVQNHSGNMTVDSAPGQGATFTIELPLTHPSDRGDKDGK